MNGNRLGPGMPGPGRQNSGGGIGGGGGMGPPGGRMGPPGGPMGGNAAVGYGNPSGEIMAMLKGGPGDYGGDAVGAGMGYGGPMAQMSTDHGGGGGGDSGVFDMSDFPSLGGPRPGDNSGGGNPYQGGGNSYAGGGLGGGGVHAGPGGSYQGTLHKLGAAPPEFSIQHEDFPTLGGQVSCKDFPTLPGQTASGGGVGGTGMGMGGPGGYDSYQQQQQQFQFQQQQAQQAQSQFANSHMGLPGKSGGPVEPGSGSDGPSIAAGSGGGGLATAEEYGLLGLLKIIRMTDVDLNTLALGQDLTTLGLNLNSQEANLYATFGSPWADPPLTREPDYILPACYYTQPPPFKREHLGKFSLKTLFYIFYMMPRDVLQVHATRELCRRDWRYHKEMGRWFTFERGAYFYFDTAGFEKRGLQDSSVARNLSQGFMTEQELAELPVN